MKYYIYDTEKGYEEFGDLKEASEKFLKDEFTSRYSAFGITEGAAAVDVIFKKNEDDEVTLSGSGDFLSSSLLGQKPKELMTEVIGVYRALNYPEYNLMSIIASHNAVKLEAEEMEMM